MKAPSSKIRHDLPDWITPDLIAETLDVWQSSYPEGLTEEGAIEILLSVAHLFNLLMESDDETVPGAGKGL